MLEGTVNACVCVCVCVCVEHLNRCKTSLVDLTCRGTGADFFEFAYFLHGFRNLTTILFWLFGSLFELFSPFRNADLWMYNFDLVLVLPFTFSYMEFPMNTSQRTLFDLGLVWLCMYGIQFPTDPMKDHFLSSVISMVAPTCSNMVPWTHWREPIWETVD